MKRRSIAIVLAFAGLTAGHASAGGIPRTGALMYAGTLQDASGGSLEGEHNIEVKLWSSADEQTSPACTGGSQAIALQSGRFSLTLPDACTAAVSSNPNLWIDVLVDGASTGRSKLSVVPYAVEAGHASAADTATRATNADKAAQAMAADSAKQCASADNATHASKADNATHAGAADQATNATRAETTGRADSAANADNAGRANSAAQADFASTAATLTGAHTYTLDWTGSELRFIVDVTHVKNFIIDHPSDPERYLIHTTLEGPENGVYYRGSARLQNGSAEVALPSYFEAATRVEGRTVLLTSTFHGAAEPISPLAASAVRQGRFTVRAIDAANPNQTFDWEVKAVRADVAPLLAEPRRDEVIVQGEGPYKYFTPRR